jgi:hypothetical protein
MSSSTTHGRGPLTQPEFAIAKETRSRLTTNSTGRQAALNRLITELDPDHQRREMTEADRLEAETCARLTGYPQTPPDLSAAWDNFRRVAHAVIPTWFEHHARERLLNPADRPALLTREAAWDTLLAFWLLTDPAVVPGELGLPRELDPFASARATLLNSELDTPETRDRIFEQARQALEIVAAEDAEQADDPDGAAAGWALTARPEPSTPPELVVPPGGPSGRKLATESAERIDGGLHQKGNGRSDKLPKLKAHDRQAWQLWKLAGKDQTEVACLLNKEHGTTYTQGQVSRMCTRFQRYIDAGGIAEDLPDPAKRSRTVDPGRLELGARVDPRKPRPSDMARANDDDE